MIENEDRRIRVPVELFADVSIREVANPTRVCLLLHGYGESGAACLRRLGEAMPADAMVLAPNGCFPLPAIKEDRSEIKVGFGWYFYNFLTDEYFMDMSVAVQFLRGILRHFQADQLPCTVIGFSQGGYLAPVLGLAHPPTRQVVGIGCRFLDEEIAGVPPFRMDAIHGADDPIIRLDSARKSFATLQARGVQGEFQEIPATAHRISPATVEALRKVLV